MFIKKLATAAVIALSVLPVTANAQAKIKTMEKYRTYLPSNIQLHWEPAQRKITVTVSTGCQSSSLPKARSELFVTTSESKRLIVIRGGFTRIIGPGDLMHARLDDCNGARAKTMTFEDVDLGALTVQHQDKTLWNVNLGEEPVDLSVLNQKTRSRFNRGAGLFNKQLKKFKAGKATAATGTKKISSTGPQIQ